MSITAALQRQVLLIRAGLLSLQVLSTLLVPPYDTSASEAYKTSGLLLDFIPTLGHGNWDAIYFNYLAKNGYDYERFGAFFPAYPVIIGLIASAIHFPLQLLISYDACIILCSVLLNNFLFYLNSLLVFKLGQLFGLGETRAYRAALLYALNPASVFMSVGYTESLFSFLVLLGFILREADSQWYFLCFSAATGVRSNGVSLVFFILYDHITCMIKNNQVLVVNLLCMSVQAALCVAPFYLFQNHLFEIYCNSELQNSEFYLRYLFFLARWILTVQ